MPIWNLVCGKTKIHKKKGVYYMLVTPFYRSFVSDANVQKLQFGDMMLMLGLLLQQQIRLIKFQAQLSILNGERP